MIPKKIHYCWFGGKEKPRLARRCIESWRKMATDWEIIEWNEGNFDLDQHPYLRRCHELGRWAYLSDLARLLVVEQHGGVYLDTDVELLRNPDELCEGREAFFGFETPEWVASGLGFGASAHHPVMQAMVGEYEQFREEPDKAPIGCPRLNTAALEKLGLKRDGSLQDVAGATILPISVLNPYNPVTGRLSMRPETVAIHWYGKSALPWWSRWRSWLLRPYHRLMEG